MLHDLIERRLTVFYSDGSKLLSLSGVLTQYDAKHGILKLNIENKEVLFPLTSVIKIEILELQQEVELEAEVETFEHRGHDFW